MYSLHADEFKHIGASNTVVQWVRDGVEFPFIREPDECFNRNRIFTDQHAKFVDKEIIRLLSIGAVEQVSYKPKCILSMRVVPKKSGKSHLVTDCRPVNSNIDCPSFTQEGISAVSNEIQQDDVLMTVNIKDGFHHVLIKEQFGIYWREKFYVWRTCFGMFWNFHCPLLLQ